MSYVQRQYDDEARAADEAFDPSEEGYCRLCGIEDDLDSGLCVNCHEAQLDGTSDFDIAEGAYWFHVDFHGGQGCPYYAAQCRSDFRPGAMSNGPEDGSDAADHYAGLVAGETHPEEGASRRF